MKESEVVFLISNLLFFALGFTIGRMAGYRKATINALKIVRKYSRWEE